MAFLARIFTALAFTANESMHGDSGLPDIACSAPAECSKGVALIVSHQVKPLADAGEAGMYALDGT